MTLLLLAVYRIGAHIPTPGINAQALMAYFKAAQGTLLGLFDMFSGGALSHLSVFALGIMPYISASIILQLLTVVIPALERLSKEGEAGRRKITQYTRYGTVVLSIIQGFGISVGLENMMGPETFLSSLSPVGGSASLPFLPLPPAQPLSCGSVSRSPSAGLETGSRSSFLPVSLQASRTRLSVRRGSFRPVK